MNRNLTACVLFACFAAGFSFWRFHGDKRQPGVRLIQDMASSQTGWTLPPQLHTLPQRSSLLDADAPTGDLSDIPLIWSSPEERRRLSALGERMYSIHCAHCHGADGQGRTPVTDAVGMPQIASFGAESHTRRSLAGIYGIVSRGQGNMPAFAGVLSLRETWAAALHVRRLRDEREETDEKEPGSYDE